MTTFPGNAYEFEVDNIIYMFAIRYYDSKNHVTYYADLYVKLKNRNSYQHIGDGRATRLHNEQHFNAMHEQLLKASMIRCAENYFDIFIESRPFFDSDLEEAKIYSDKKAKLVSAIKNYEF